MSAGAPRRDSRWWGWGDPAHESRLPPDAVRLLAERIGTGEGGRVALGDVRLPEARSIPQTVARAAGADRVFAGDEDRLRHAAGQSYPDLIRMRSGQIDEAPDAVLVPPDAAAIAGILSAAS
ncbi:MAG: hypothetical protein ACR2N5_07075 [Solirubrobacterales bacterium]